MTSTPRYLVNPRLRETPRYVAVHEAGHAVARWALSPDLSEPFDRIFIRTPREAAAPPYVIGGVEGRLFYQPFGCYLPDRTLLDLLDFQREDMEREVIDCFAGPVAEARARHISLYRALTEGGSQDCDAAHSALKDFYRPGAELDAASDALLKRAVKLVSQHWSAINALADELMDRRSLSGDEAVAVMHGWRRLSIAGSPASKQAETITA